MTTASIAAPSDAPPADEVAYGSEQVVPRATLKKLAKRNDRTAMAYLVGHLGLLALTGFLLHESLGTWWLVPAMLAHAVVMAFLFAPMHELSHGTAFRTRWLNEAVLWLSSFVWGESPTHRRFAHSHHHSYTWHWKVDAQMGYSNPVPLRTYLGDVIGLVEFWPRLKLTLRHASGRILERERTYLAEAEVPKVVREARILLTGYLALLANLAMLTGLLGTVSGLITSFGAVSGESVDPSQKARILAEGISEAMNCTAFGLIVAIIALIWFAILNGKTQQLEDDINEASVQVLNLIINNRQKVNMAGIPAAA